MLRNKMLKNFVRYSSSAFLVLLASEAMAGDHDVIYTDENNLSKEMSMHVKKDVADVETGNDSVPAESDFYDMYVRAGSSWVRGLLFQRLRIQSREMMTPF